MTYSLIFFEETLGIVLALTIYVLFGLFIFPPMKWLWDKWAKMWNYNE